MNFKIYIGEKAKNDSVNITCTGEFEAVDIKEAIKIITVNTKYRYCAKWQFSFENAKYYIKPLHEYLKYDPFVCLGDPFESNVIWKSPNAVIRIHENKL